MYKIWNVLLLTATVSLRYCLLVERQQELGYSQCTEAAGELRLAELTVPVWTAVAYNSSHERCPRSDHHSRLVCTGLYIHVYVH